MDQLEHLKMLQEEVAKLEHKLRPLQAQLTLAEWCEVIRRDMEDEFLRRQNQLQAHIRHATQVIAEREMSVQALPDDGEWCDKHQHGTYMGRCASCRDEHLTARGSF